MICCFQNKYYLKWFWIQLSRRSLQKEAQYLWLLDTKKYQMLFANGNSISQAKESFQPLSKETNFDISRLYSFSALREYLISPSANTQSGETHEKNKHKSLVRTTRWPNFAILMRERRLFTTVRASYATRRVWERKRHWAMPRCNIFTQQRHLAAAWAARFAAAGAWVRWGFSRRCN